MKYIVNYSQTESGLQNYLESISTPANPIYEKEFNTLKEAESFAKREVETTSLKKVEDLDFSPSEKETQTNVCHLEILSIDEDGEIELLNHTSDCGLWIE
ncbi:hypothetical protein [Bacteroides pyogenes]|uniref:hypothetical protein n=1 Tax=Bacteroides pyogenes TaxID=310300 RepID=UPI002FDB195F